MEWSNQNMFPFCGKGILCDSSIKNIANWKKYVGEASTKKNRVKVIVTCRFRQQYAI